MNYKIGDKIVVVDTEFTDYDKLKDRIFVILHITSLDFMIFEDDLLKDIIKNQSIIIQLLTILTKRV